jgi:hypothetical protein
MPIARPKKLKGKNAARQQGIMKRKGDFFKRVNGRESILVQVFGRSFIRV